MDAVVLNLCTFKKHKQLTKKRATAAAAARVFPSFFNLHRFVFRFRNFGFLENLC